MQAVLAKYLLGALFVGYSAAYFLLIVPLALIGIGLAWLAVARFQTREPAQCNAEKNRC